MTIFEIADQLPNGFHDSEVESIRIDYVSRTLELALNVWVGGSDVAPETREAYRRALVWIRGLQYCVIDPPDERYPFSASHALTIDVAEPTLLVPKPALFGCRVWVAEWNAFFHIAAGSAEFAWAGAPTYRRS
jgi:hypothetical protein